MGRGGGSSVNVELKISRDIGTMCAHNIDIAWYNVSTYAYVHNIDIVQCVHIRMYIHNIDIGTTCART